MKLLADENIEPDIVHWLRDTGHDVMWVAELLAGATDAQVIEAAEAQGRIILTHDLDFGEFVFRQRRCQAGVVLLRLTVRGASSRLEMPRRHWPEIEERATGHISVVTEASLRVRPLWLS